MHVRGGFGSVIANPKTVEPHPLLGSAGFILTAAGAVAAILGFALLWAILHTGLLVYSALLWGIAAVLLTAGGMLMSRDLRPSRRGRVGSRGS